MADNTMLNTLSESIANCPDNIDWEKALDYTNDEYGRAAFYIVEPKMNEEDEKVFIWTMENDIQNWVNWVNQCSGEDPNWIKLANLVAENGY